VFAEPAGGAKELEWERMQSGSGLISHSNLAMIMEAGKIASMANLKIDLLMYSGYRASIVRCSNVFCS
jgi:hypothetical protein